MSAPDQQPKLGPSWVPQNAATPPEWKQPPSPKPGMPKAAKITLGIFGGLVLIGGCNAIITGGKGTDSTPTLAAKPAPAPTVTVTVTQTVAAAAAPAVTVTAAAAPAEPAKEPAPAPGDSFAGSGTYLVGDDIQPGTYKTAGPGSLGHCYWERDKDSSGGFDSIIANDNLTGQGVVTIKSSDKVFKTTGCQAWVKAK
ncbi:hypothetical protein [Kitasatospora indigofera]|uniref:hypothetical protein n=1 Tax=Kitasatospora indigofera TaxID=67307 RepID=UPI00369AC7F8